MSLYMKYLSIHLRSAMQHKVSFLLTVCGNVMTSISAAIVVMMLFQRFGTVEGFTLEQVMICYSVVLMAFSLAECFARGFDTFPRLMGNGQFDRMLVRPRNEVFQVLASTVELTRIGRLIQAAAVLVYAVPNCGVEWTAARAALLAFMILGGTALFAALFLPVMVLMAVFMRWFPLENPGAWLLFIGLFVAVFAVMTLGFEVYFRIVGRRYDGLLGQYRLQRERER